MPFIFSTGCFRLFHSRVSNVVGETAYCNLPVKNARRVAEREREEGHVSIIGRITSLTEETIQ